MEDRVVAQEDRGLMIVSRMRKWDAPGSPDIGARVKGPPATTVLQPARPSNGVTAPCIPARASIAAKTPARPAWPDAAAFQWDRCPLRACPSALLGTTTSEMH